MSFEKDVTGVMLEAKPVFKAAGPEDVAARKATFKPAKSLEFECGSTWYAVSLDPDTLGHFTKYGESTFELPHSSWVMIGYTKHHWSNHPIPLTSDVDPEVLKRAHVWDRDHGTIRQWGGRTITSAYVVQ